jgi:hypothetical protein
MTRKCESLKIGYDTRAEALEACEAQMLADLVDPGCHIMPYACELCGAWHTRNQRIVFTEAPTNLARADDRRRKDDHWPRRANMLPACRIPTEGEHHTMTDTDTAPTETPTDATPGADAIARCACGVPLGTAHYCTAQDHNWVKAPEPDEPSDG